MRRIAGVGLVALVALAAGCSGGSDREATGGGQARAGGGERTAPGTNTGATALYTTQVLPILKTNCYRCHGGMNHRGGLNVQTQAGMMKGGKSGVDVIAGDPEHSLLVISMRHEGSSEKPKPMPPPPRPKLSDAEIAVVARWIKEGALMPADQEKP